MNALASFAAGIVLGLLVVAITYFSVLPYTTDVPLTFIFTGERQ